MPPCDQCDALLWQPLSVNRPHDALTGGAIYVLQATVLERYVCRRCHTIWDRLRNKTGGHPHQWKMLLAADHS
jgi:hypothetical protein